MNAKLADLIRDPGDLPTALRDLRREAESAPDDTLLMEWGRSHLDLSPDGERQWFERAWWGLHAGELMRACLGNAQHRSQALSLIDKPDLSKLESARAKHGGVILAGAHVGPPKTAMNFLMDHRLPLMIWTDMGHFPEWMKTAFNVTFVDPANNPALLAKTAFHLRDGGVLFGAPDAPSGRMTMECDGVVRWTFSLGIPTLARMLSVPVFRFLALWEDERIRIACEEAVPPANDRNDEEWNQQWVGSFSERLDHIVQTSPENLRFLLFIDNAAISRSLRLFSPQGGL